MLKMPEKVPLHEIDCAITGSNLGPGGRIWKSPSLPDMTAVRAMQLNVHLEHGLDGAMDPSLIMSTISEEDKTAKVSLQCAMCLFRTAKLKLSKARQRFSSHLHSHSRQRFNMMLEERPRHAISLILSTANI